MNLGDLPLFVCCMLTLALKVIRYPEFDINRAMLDR